MIIKGLPHSIDLFWREGQVLASDHVAATDDQIRLPERQELYGLINFGIVIGGAIGTIQVTDGHYSTSLREDLPFHQPRC
jgi:hypothetical protein